MENERLAALNALLAQDGNNTFARYAIAIECTKSGDLEAAVEHFRELIARSPDYAAAYFHGGQTLEKMGDVDGARAMYERGIEVTGRTGDAHTQSELQAALDILPI